MIAFGRHRRCTEQRRRRKFFVQDSCHFLCHQFGVVGTTLRVVHDLLRMPHPVFQYFVLLCPITTTNLTFCCVVGRPKNTLNIFHTTISSSRSSFGWRPCSLIRSIELECLLVSKQGTHISLQHRRVVSRGVSNIIRGCYHCRRQCRWNGEGCQ